MIAIDLGSGVNKPAGYIGIDKWRWLDCDVIADIAYGLPFRDESVDLIRAKDVMEHLREIIPIFNECWRVLKPGGVLKVEVPRYPHVDAVKDPTHVSFFAVETFTEYLCGPDRLAMEYGMAMWDPMPYVDAALTRPGLQFDERRIWATLTPRQAVA